MAPYPEISSYPPLGQLTILHELTEEIKFTVLIEWHGIRPRYPFEVELCYGDAASNVHRGQQSRVALRKSVELPALIRENDDEYQTVSYSGILVTKCIPNYVLFTFKYRVDPFAPWKWIEIPGGVSTGELLFHTPNAERNDQVPVLESSWRRSPIDLGNGAAAHELTSSVMIPKGDYQQAELPSQVLQTIASALRFMAITQLEPYWLGVIQDRGQFYTTEDSLIICYLTPIGKSVALLALNSSDDTYTVFRPGPKGEILVCSRSDCDETTFQCFEAISASPHEAIATVMAAARKRLSESSRKLQKFHSQMTRAPVTAPDHSFFDNFSFCTWNALGQDLTAKKLLNGLDKLSAAGINISTLLIDDNWQTLGPTSYDYTNSFYRGFNNFPANQEIGKFSELIPQLRSKHPSIRYIGVWHALLGYWGGLAANGELANHYKTRTVKSKLMGNVPAEILIVDPTDVDRFFDDFYSYLSSQGIDFVKTDVQHMLDMFTSLDDRHDCIAPYQATWTSAYIKHFSGKAISCMSMIPEILFHSMLQDKTPKVMYRNSDDFYPEIPASHPWHVWVNAHNTLLTQNLNVVPDWDMFQTSHPYSSYHAAARCISGGPIMITDVPGEHDLDLIKQIVAESPEGRTIAIRPSIATTMDVWSRYADGNVLKIGTTAGSNGEYGMIGLFNIAEKEKHTMIPVGDFPGIKEGSKVIVRSYRTGQIFGPLNVRKSKASIGVNDLLQIKLEFRGWEILTTYPVHKVQRKDGHEANLAILGLEGKMSGVAAVTRCDVQEAAQGSKIAVELKALGVLGIWYEGASPADIDIAVEGKTLEGKDQTWSSIGQDQKLGHIEVLRFGRDNNMWKDQATAFVEITI